jgi:hypothetical protein
MVKRIFLSIIVVLIGSFIALTWGVDQKPRDPFKPYRQAQEKPLAIEKQTLTNFGVEEALIREKLKLSLSQRERSILAGLHWILGLVDDDETFFFIFSDFLLLMNVLGNSEDRDHQREVVLSIIKTSLGRAEKKLASIYKHDENSRAAFICMLQALSRFPEYYDTYVEFYNKHFPKPPNNDAKDDEEFANAMSNKDYKTLFDHLVASSLLHFSLKKLPKDLMVLPKDRLQVYWKNFESFDYPDHAVFSQEFRTLGYLVTHVVLGLTNYGEFPIDQSKNRQKAEDYIEASNDKVSNQLGDFDLFAEYVQSIKIFSDGQDKRVDKLEDLIYGLQRSDGSWGSKRDFTTNPYTAIHPTGAALMALNQSNLRKNFKKSAEFPY